MTIPTNSAAQEPRVLPDGLELARTTPTWTASTVPKALLATHQAGAWAELVVEAGRVEFVEHGTGRAVDVAGGEHTVIAPGIDHHIAPTHDAAFAIRFYRQTAEPANGSTSAPADNS